MCLSCNRVTGVWSKVEICIWEIHPGKMWTAWQRSGCFIPMLPNTQDCQQVPGTEERQGAVTSLQPHEDKNLIHTCFGLAVCSMVRQWVCVVKPHFDAFIMTVLNAAHKYLWVLPGISRGWSYLQGRKACSVPFQQCKEFLDSISQPPGWDVVKYCLMCVWVHFLCVTSGLLPGIHSDMILFVYLFNRPLPLEMSRLWWMSLLPVAITYLVGFCLCWFVAPIVLTQRRPSVQAVFPRIVAMLVYGKSLDHGRFYKENKIMF